MVQISVGRSPKGILNSRHERITFHKFEISGRLNCTIDTKRSAIWIAERNYNDIPLAQWRRCLLVAYSIVTDNIYTICGAIAMHNGDVTLAGLRSCALAE